MRAVIEAAPLPVFLIYSRFIEQSHAQDWLGPYLAGALVGLITSAWLLHNKMLLNRLFVGINLYLVSGSIGLLFHLDWLNQWYGELRAGGMLGWIIVVGIVSIVISRRGFVGVEFPDRKKVVIISLLLLLGAVMAFLISLQFAGDRIFSEVVPFVALFLLQGRLKSTLQS